MCPKRGFAHEKALAGGCLDAIHALQPRSLPKCMPKVGDPHSGAGKFARRRRQPTNAENSKASTQMAMETSDVHSANVR
jgi:hypothetical protein